MVNIILITREITWDNISGTRTTAHVIDTGKEYVAPKGSPLYMWESMDPSSNRYIVTLSTDMRIDKDMGGIE